MKRYFDPIGRLLIPGLVLGLTILPFTAPVRACTIFVLTDTNRVLFCNNEDWSNPKTRIWFVPAGTGHHGCVYVGFDDDFPQGGVNTEGLACDWVAGYTEKWEPDLSVANAWGNSGQRVLETCATVQDAIAFYRSRRDPSFYRAKILVADRTGASVIIGARDGKLEVEQAGECRGFGYGERTLDKMLKTAPEPTATNGFKILRARAQQGQYATKYSNVFDLKSGDIFLYPFPESDDEVKFNLAAELKKGGHYYDMPQIHEQQAQPLRPLLANMKRPLLDGCKPIPDTEPKVTAHLRAIIQAVAAGTVREEDFTADLWKKESPDLKNAQASLKSFGGLISLSPVDRSEEGGKRAYHYRVEFKNALLLQKFVFDQEDKLAVSDTEDLVTKFSP